MAERNKIGSALKRTHDADDVRHAEDVASRDANTATICSGMTGCMVNPTLDELLPGE
jgi:hypothetical protein